MSRGKGAIAADLRQAGIYWWRLELPESMAIWRAARVSLGLPEVITSAEGWQFAPDISSEAIEHAEALGL